MYGLCLCLVVTGVSKAIRRLPMALELRMAFLYRLLDVTLGDGATGKLLMSNFFLGTTGMPTLFF